MNAMILYFHVRSVYGTEPRLHCRLSLRAWLATLLPLLTLTMLLQASAAGGGTNTCRTNQSETADVMTETVISVEDAV